MGIQEGPELGSENSSGWDLYYKMQKQKQQDDKERLLREAQPSWTKDGMGVVGNNGRGTGRLEKGPELGSTGSSGWDLYYKMQREKLSVIENKSESSSEFEDIKQEIPYEDVKQCYGFGLYLKDRAVWVNLGTVNGEIPENFDLVYGKKVAEGGTGVVYAKVEIDQEVGEIKKATIENGSNFPASSFNTFHYLLGRYELSANKAIVVNCGCGSIDVSICRNWFAKDPPFFGVTLTRCGCGHCVEDYASAQ